MSFESDMLASLRRVERRLAKLESKQFAGNGETYAITNGSVDRTYDADATTVAELADALYTLITDLSTGKTPKI